VDEVLTQVGLCERAENKVQKYSNGMKHRLLLGILFEKQQDMVGWMTALLLLLVGTVLVKMLGVELPALVKSLLTWVPSVALAEICRAIFSETVSAVQVWINFGIVIVVSLPLYGLVIWKVQRSDR